MPATGPRSRAQRRLVEAGLGHAPSTRAGTSGASPYPSFLGKQPGTPKTGIGATSNVEPCTPYAPAAQMTTITGAITEHGKRAIAARQGTMVSTAGSAPMSAGYLEASGPALAEGRAAAR